MPIVTRHDLILLAAGFVASIFIALDYWWVGALIFVAGGIYNVLAGRRLRRKVRRHTRVVDPQPKIDDPE